MFRLIITTFCLLISLNSFSKTVIISDVDDTIRTTFTMGNYFELATAFAKGGIYKNLRNIFKDIGQSEDTDYYYVSATYDLLYNQQKWLKKKGFPKGEAIYRSIRSGKTYKFKKYTIEKILKKYSEKERGEIQFLFFGDNSSHDEDVYIDILKENPNLKASVFIRDVATHATYWRNDMEIIKKENINYFFSEKELLSHSEFSLISMKTRNQIQKEYQLGEIVPANTMKILKRRIIKLKGCDSRKCKRESKEEALDLWVDYHLR
jgi:phosphatidate phosphatase APP1